MRVNPRRETGVEVIGFEPTASWLQTRRSARLSYTPGAETILPTRGAGPAVGAGGQ